MPGLGCEIKTSSREKYVKEGKTISHLEVQICSFFFASASQWRIATITKISHKLHVEGVFFLFIASPASTRVSTVSNQGVFSWEVLQW